MSAGMHWWAIPRMGPALSFADAGILCHWTFPRIEISAVAVWLEVSVALCGGASSDGMKIERATGGVSAVGKVSLDEGLSGRVTRESKAPEVEVGAKQ